MWRKDSRALLPFEGWALQKKEEGNMDMKPEWTRY